MRILVVGAGYIGLPLAQKLALQGNEVTGWVASETSALVLREAGLQACWADVADEKAWQDPKIAHGRWDALYYCVSSSRGGIEAYEKVYLRGLKLALQAQAKRLIYTSSTSVYGQNDGSWVDETLQPEPTTAIGQVLVEAEKTILGAKGIVARLTGIYGPGRGYLLKKLMEGAAVIEGDAQRWLNQIHRDDVVLALEHLLHLPQAEGEIFNVTDNEPVQLIDFYAWLCKAFQKPIPAKTAIPRERKRSITSKRVSNAKLRAMGWEPYYPTFREGYTEGVGKINCP